jgi:hypothetical protein
MATAEAGNGSPTWRFFVIVAGVVLFVFGMTAVDDWREPRIVAEAVLNVAPAGTSRGEITLMNAGSFSWGTTLWCSSVPGRTPGQVAVLVRKGRKQLISSVEEVAPAWVDVRTDREVQMLAECASLTGSGPPALP